VLIAFDGGAWVPLLQDVALLGLGTLADAVNPFSAKLNGALWTARYDSEGGDGNLRYTLNKEESADTLSMLFQTDWSGRAEIGLIGDDNVRLKVFPDGSAWIDAVVVDRATGRIGLGMRQNLCSTLHFREVLPRTRLRTYMPPVRRHRGCACRRARARSCARGKRRHRTFHKWLYHSRKSALGCGRGAVRRKCADTH
jgi:hypothetical protein